MLLCVLGSQPGLSIAELESLVGSDMIQPLGNDYALIKANAGSINHKELGGTIKIAEVVKVIPSSRWNKVSAAAFDEIVKHLMYKAIQSSHKLTLGISAYGFIISPKKLWLLSFEINKNLKKNDHSLRIVMGKEFALNSAQVIHNKLTGEFGFEFLLVSHAGKAYLSRTLSVQDIDSYSKRDYGKPERDMRVGMMPPKLAQIMLNLANVTKDNTVLDPFCGTGSVLIEAAMRHSKLEGSDIKQQMLDYTKANLDWLAKEYSLNISYKLTRADATTHKWNSDFDRIVAETYLGPSIKYMHNNESIKETIDYCNDLIKKFLSNLKPQLTKDSRCCIAVPVWNSKNGFIHLPIVRQLDQMGYNRVILSHVNFADLIYYRSDQIVGRELLILTLK